MVTENENRLTNGAQGGVDLGVAKQKTPEQLAREVLRSKSNQVLFLFAERVTSILHEEVRGGRGRQTITSTQEGRVGEHLIGIDQPAETKLKEIIREVQLPAVLVSENTPEPTEFGGGNGNTEKVFIYTDPFDNSSPYKRGLDIPPYSVCSIWYKDGQPIGAVIVDIKDRKAYVSMDGETFMWDLEKKSLEKQAFADWENKSLKDHVRLLYRRTQLLANNPDQVKQLNEIDMQIAETIKMPQNQQERSTESIEAEKVLIQKRDELISKSPELQQLMENGKQISDIKDKAKKNETLFIENQQKEPERKKITRSERITLTDQEATLASFLGEKEFSLEFFGTFKTLVKNMHQKGFLYPGGGAFIHGLLASGAIDAYVMRNEPLSEIIPGLPLALAAGCTAVSVNEDGSYREFKFNPNALKEDHKLYSEGLVSLFIAAATPEIRDEIIRYYLEEKTKMAMEEKRRLELEEFVKSKPEEFEIFKASHQPKTPSSN